MANAQIPHDFSFKGIYKIAAPAEMTIATNDGFINVGATESNEIEVFFIVKKDDRVLDINLEELRSHLNVSITNSADRLEIIITQKDSDWTKSWKDRYNVSLQINAPQRTSCTLKTSDGDISLKKMEGEQECKTSDGNIAVEDIKGKLTAQTSDGDITLIHIQGNCELITSDGNIKAGHIQGSVSGKTSDGDIVLKDVEGENNARTSDGDILFEGMNGSLNAQTSDGDIRGDLTQLRNPLYLKTSDGNISVTIPDGLGLDLILKGEEISTKLTNFSGDKGDHHVEGKINGGGISVELVTSDGDITINYQ